jgi:hypothetical protein
MYSAKQLIEQVAGGEDPFFVVKHLAEAEKQIKKSIQL